MTPDLDAPPFEFSAAEWETRAPELRDRKAFHDPSCTGCGVHEKGDQGCGPDCEHLCRVFLCRAPNSDHACGRYVGACVGGDDDNRCADCWCRLQKALERRAKRTGRRAA